jgi:subtilisin family serine protease
MKKTIFKHLIASALALGLLSSCGPSGPVINSAAISNPTSMSAKANTSDDVLKGWGHKDLMTDSLPGMSVEKAYTEILNDYKGGETVTVAVIDAGTDIEHEDLKNNIWVNKDEVAGNNKDDDNNGYVDDIHGWNFLGELVNENLEFVRILREMKPKFEGKTESDIADADKADFKLYQKAQGQYDKDFKKAEQSAQYYNSLKKSLSNFRDDVRESSGKQNLTLEDIKKFEPSGQQQQQIKMRVTQIMKQEPEFSKIMDQLDGGIKHFQDQLDYNLNKDFVGREKIGDDENDITDTEYGNANVMGPQADKENILHGTHVAGIIGAERNNGIGMNGVAKNVKIMVVRAVPNGDEYDKDIALGIRYAVDNGAKVINTSFGKYYSTHPDWVLDAIKYAAKNDVLIVNASGNEGQNIDDDENHVYPDDRLNSKMKEVADNFVSVGALNYEYGENLIASFSNYGQEEVDVFAPGNQIWSTTPNDEYEFLQGTSMASPEVAGVAAVIRSVYPKLSAPQVKKVLMQSGLMTTQKVRVGGSEGELHPFNELSKSGKMVNLYNALIMASKM